MAGGLLALLQNPDQMRKAREQPAVWDSTGADEVVRWVTPIRHMMRTATVDYELGGQTIRAGDGLCLFYLSANRDEEVFADPFRFDLERASGRHLAFGIGNHFCLGRLLALTEIRALFKQLLARLEHIELAGEARPAQSNFIGGLKNLPVRYRFN
jgi:cytochrome P450